MISCTKRVANCGNSLVFKKLYMLRNTSGAFDFFGRGLHTTAAVANYAATQVLPIPNNIDAAETTRFSPLRSRDISATVMLSQYGQMNALAMPTIDITADNSLASNDTKQDPHLESYDCFGAVSLNSAMQSNVPTPFGGMHKFTHLNMPGGQWSQEYKFMSQNLHSAHYTTLRRNARAGWVSYDQNATLDRQEHKTNWNIAHITKRHYSSSAGAHDQVKTPMTKKEQMKQAFKDYGATVIIFHVSLSLLSLGGCYLLVSGGIDMVPLLKYLGLESSTLSNKLVTDGSTFVVAYAIHKVFAPVRISVTLGATPFIVRYLRSKGVLKVKVIKQKSN